MILTSIKIGENGVIYPSTLSFGADIFLVIKVAHICPYPYTNGSHIPLPLQNGTYNTLHLTEVKKLVLNLYLLLLIFLKKLFSGIYVSFIKVQGIF